MATRANAVAGQQSTQSTARGAARPTAGGSRTSRTRQAILDAAAAVFLRSGYLGSSIDKIAAVAGVSKQTVYNQFSDKESLFTEVIRATVGPIQDSFLRLIHSYQGTAGFEAELRDIGRRLATTVARPEVVQLRRIVVGEADRFPELARSWYEQGPERCVETLAARFAQYATQGFLQATDMTIAAQQFNWLVLGHAVNKMMFSLPQNPFTKRDLESLADAGVRTFLAAYGGSATSRSR